MDLFCCGMYRSCSTWQYDVAQEVLLFATRSDAQLRVEPCGYLTGPEYARAEVAARSRSQIRLFKGHEGHPAYSAAMYRSRAMGIYAHRDVRDVIFSLMFKRRQTFQEIIRTGMARQILVNDRFWRLHPQVMVQRYDEIMAKPAESIMEIAGFLGVELPASEAGRIAAAFSRDANLRRAKGIEAELSARGVDLEGAENAQVYDRQTLLHWNHIRPESRGWRELATPEERIVMQKMLGDWLAENEYEADRLDDLQTEPRHKKTWRLDAAEGMLRCHSRELSSRYYRWAEPVKRTLGLGAGEKRSRPLAEVANG